MFTRFCDGCESWARQLSLSWTIQISLAKSSRGLFFLFSQKLSDLYSTLSIVALREEKFFAAYRQGLFDAYGTRKFHIGSPELIHVIKKRLAYGLKRYQE